MVESSRLMQAGVLILVIAVIALTFVMLNRYDFSKKNYIEGYIIKEQSDISSYNAFQQVCTKGEDYFKEIARGVYDNDDELHVIEIKKKSILCQTSETKEISEDFYDSLTCKCIEWKGKRTCPDGYTLSGEMCKSGSSLTNSYILCSKFLCNDGWVVDVTYK